MSFYARKNESVYWKLPLSESTVERGQTAPGIPCSDISIDQRAASAILSTTVAASGRGLYVSHVYKTSE